MWEATIIPNIVKTEKTFLFYQPSRDSKDKGIFATQKSS